MSNMTACVATALVSFAVSSLFGIVLIPFLRRLKYGQTINDVGPTWHQKKQGTPTMGGLMFIAGVLAATAAGGFLLAGEGIAPLRLIYALLMALGFGLIGFFDDYIKVVKKRNLGLTALQKIILQLAVSSLYLFSLYLLDGPATVVWIPWIGSFDFGVLYYPFAVFAIVGFVNAVNLTDGIDGLAGSVTFVAALGYMVLATLFSNMEMNLLATALAGGCLGFLVWNIHPAKVFMGDTGSMFLGGIVVAVAFGLHLPLLLPLVGVIYLCEAFSVILQVISFKTTGRRIFKMSPIHHHFELSGWSETKIVVVFSIVTLLGCVLALLAALQI